MIMERLQPNASEAEQSILGVLLLENSLFEQVDEFLNKEDFYQNQNQIIYEHIKKLSADGKAFDLITVSESLRKENLEEKIGGFSYLTKLITSSPSLDNIKPYALIIKERSKLRHLLDMNRYVADLVYQPEGRSADEIIDEAEQKILSVGDQYSNITSEGPVFIKDIMNSLTDRLDMLSKNTDGVTGLATDFKDLDQKTSGLHDSNLIIIAGRPSMGKTTFAMNIAENVSLKNDKPVIVFSLEMPKEDLIMRMVSSIGNIPQNNLRSGRLNDEDWGKIGESMEIINNNSNMYIDDRPGLSPATIRAVSRRIARENDGVSLIVIDYLQLMKCPGYENNRVQEVSEISRSLKALSKELKVPVIALSQLNRGVDERKDKRPLMSDLRESGAIEQDADVIMFVYRDEVYNKDNPDNKGVGEIILGKQRNGALGTVNVIFQGEFCRFRDYANISPESYSENSEDVF